MADRIAALVRRLKDRTDAGTIPWETTSDKNTFMAAFPDYSINIKRTQPYDEWQYSLTILNDFGITLDEIGEDDLQDRLSAKQKGEATKLLQKIFAGARHKAMGVDKAIDSILAILGGDDDDIPF